MPRPARQVILASIQSSQCPKRVNFGLSRPTAATSGVGGKADLIRRKADMPPPMSGFGGKADVRRKAPKSLLLAKKRHSRPIIRHCTLAHRDAVGWEPSTASRPDVLLVSLEPERQDYGMGHYGMRSGDRTAATEARYGGRTVRLKWHKLRRFADDPPFARRNLRAGLAAGASLEVDIRALACGRFVCLHDPLLEQIGRAHV
jgi:hypothetical protein